MRTPPKSVMAKDEAVTAPDSPAEASGVEEVVLLPAATKEEQERYRQFFLAALTGFCCNPSMGGAQHEELAATAAERAVTGQLDIHPTLRK